VNIILNLLGWLAAVISMAGSLLIAAAAVFVSWYFASDSCQADRCDRLRWVVTAREDIAAGQQFTDRLINEGLHHTTVAVDAIAPRGEIANQYARLDGMASALTNGGAPRIDTPVIRAGTVIERHMVGPTVWVADAAEAIVPVAVDPEFAAGVLPGSRVVFMAKLEKTPVWQGVPKCGVAAKESTLAPQSLGYIVVSKTEGTDTHKAVIAVRINQREAASMLALSDGVWRPIVITPSKEKMCIPANTK
jgi:hypothetical protein